MNSCVSMYTHLHRSRTKICKHACIHIIMRVYMYSPTHSLTHSLTHALTHALTRLPSFRTHQVGQQTVGRSNMFTQFITLPSHTIYHNSVSHNLPHFCLTQFTTLLSHLTYHISVSDNKIKSIVSPIITTNQPSSCLIRFTTLLSP